MAISPTSRTSIDTKALVEAGYDHIAPAFLDFSIKHALTSVRSTYFNKLLSRLPEGASVLELGCGAGVLCTRTLIERGHNVTGVDISSAQIALAKQHVPTATLIHGDMMSLEFAPGTFDAVMAFYSIIHLQKEEQEAMIRKIAGWLRVGGLFLCNLSTEEGDVYEEDWLGARMFWSGWSAKGNSEMLQRDGVGLKIVEDEVVGEKEGPQEVLVKFQWLFAVKEN